MFFIASTFLYQINKEKAAFLKFVVLNWQQYIRVDCNFASKGIEMSLLRTTAYNLLLVLLRQTEKAVNERGISPVTNNCSVDNSASVTAWNTEISWQMYSSDEALDLASLFRLVQIISFSSRVMSLRKFSLELIGGFLMVLGFCMQLNNVEVIMKEWILVSLECLLLRCLWKRR